MDHDRVLALYDTQVRANPAVQPSFGVEQTGGVALITGPFNFVSFWPPKLSRGAVDALAARFQGCGETLLWRVYEHDRPAELSAWLTECGFTPSETNTLMLVDLSTAPDGFFDPGAVEVRRATTLGELDDFVRVAGLAFGDEEAWRREAYAARLQDPDLGLYVAYVDGAAASSARIEMSDGWSFALLQGGGTVPQHRGRGLYRALIAARAAEAQGRGVRYLVVDARETSRPILESCGFTPTSKAVLWTLKP